jgi:hypothetical protein
VFTRHATGVESLGTVIVSAPTIWKRPEETDWTAYRSLVGSVEMRTFMFFVDWMSSGIVHAKEPSFAVGSTMTSL